MTILGGHESPLLAGQQNPSPRLPSAFSLCGRQAYLFDCFAFLLAAATIAEWLSHESLCLWHVPSVLDAGPWWPWCDVGANCTKQGRHEALSTCAVELSHELSLEICSFECILWWFTSGTSAWLMGHHFAPQSLFSFNIVCPSPTAHSFPPHTLDVISPLLVFVCLL